MMYQLFLRWALCCGLLLGSVGAQAQYDGLWEDHFSYHHITDLAVTSKALYAATENAYFTKSFVNASVKTTSTVQGISGMPLSAFYYSETYRTFLLGYENGLLVAVNERTGLVTKMVDIINKSIPSNIKKINHFYEYNGLVYLSCDFGIVLFKPDRLEFGDTWFMGPSGQEIKVLQTTVVNGRVYAATQSYGIRSGLLSNPFLNDYSQWQNFDTGTWYGVANLNNNLVGWKNDQTLYRYQSTGGWTPFYTLPEAGVALKSNASLLTATTGQHALLFGSNFQLRLDYTSTALSADNTLFTCALSDGQNLYVGTDKAGVVLVPLAAVNNSELIVPDGPIKNAIFRMKKSSQALWVLYGAYNRTYNPYDPPNGLGQYPISLYKKTGWSQIPYSQLLGAKSLSSLAFNPKNENEVWVSSYFSGLLKINDEQATLLYSQANTAPNGLETLVIPGNPTYGPDIRVNGPVYDRSGNLWMSNNMVDKALKVLRSSGQWQSYTVATLFNDPKNVSYASLVVDRNNTKWIPTDRYGVVAFNETYNRIGVIKPDATGNLPDGDVRCVTLDKKNQLWIGTIRGLRVLSAPETFLSQDDIKTKAIIILEDGLAQELLYQQFIMDIEVDGANRKWIATADTGVYYISADGQQTIYHFTTDNSPLPSNTVNDIEIDEATGVVYIATDRGMVSFRGTATGPADSLADVFVYPNPVRPDYQGTVKISNLTDKAVVKIADIEGNLVFETTSAGGTIEWDTTAFGSYRVASGVYVVFISNQDGSDTTVKKIMIIR